MSWDDDLPPDFRAEVQRLRKTLAGKFVLRLYKEERNLWMSKLSLTLWCMAHFFLLKANSRCSQKPINNEQVDNRDHKKSVDKYHGQETACWSWSSWSNVLNRDQIRSRTRIWILISFIRISIRRECRRGPRSGFVSGSGIRISTRIRNSGS